MNRFVAAVLVGFTGAIFIWLAAPYNNFILGNAFISDDFMPVAAVFMMLLVLLVNALLLRLHHCRDGAGVMPPLGAGRAPRTCACSLLR